MVTCHVALNQHPFASRLLPCVAAPVRRFSEGTSVVFSLFFGRVLSACRRPTARRWKAALLLLAALLLASSAQAQQTVVPAGEAPSAVAVNPVTNKIYVANFNSANVTVIDGATNTAETVDAGDGPRAVAVNPVTNKIYVANLLSANVTVIDGATNAVVTVDAGAGPIAVAVNPVTNKIYVANFDSGNVTVIDGATNTAETVDAGASPKAVAVNPVTNTIYVANFGSNTVTVIDGATNTAVTVDAGDDPFAVAVNPATNKIYVANFRSDNVTVITPNAVNPLPLRVAATPVSPAVVMNEEPVVTLTATSTYQPNAPPVQHIYVQIDTWTGPWQAFEGDQLTGRVTGQSPGPHTLFAFAADGMDATSINTGQGSSPIAGQITAYPFFVGPETLAGTVTFRVNMSRELRLGNIAEGEIVGVRGSFLPLSWQRTLEMQDGDGVFIGAVAFTLGSGTEVEYKFVHNKPGQDPGAGLEGAVGSGDSGNRVFTYQGDGDLAEVFFNNITGVATEEAAEIPAAFVLDQNYPNPFNPSTRIGYGLAHRSPVHLSVYDARGRLVALLVKADQAAGWHEVTFETGALPSGVYFYRLEAGHFRAVRQMLLLR